MLNHARTLFLIGMMFISHRSVFTTALHRSNRVKRSFFFKSIRGGHTNNNTALLPRRVYLAVGSNLGDRFQNIALGLKKLCEDPSDVKLTRTSTLIETAPMYVTDQPAFLNGVVEVETTLTPHDLLHRLKEVEHDLGRKSDGIRNGPRPLDLDILFYDIGSSSKPSLVLQEDDLEIPHPRISERDFVLAPLMDIGASPLIHPVTNETISVLWDRMLQEQQNNAKTYVQILPLARGRVLHLNQTIVMGILNVTPDSFSDGGVYKGRVDLAVKEALQMVEDGADIIDIGGESTRPGAKEVAIDEEKERTIPVIEAIRKHSNVPISIDTRHAAVAEAALNAGADIVNDVSGGTFDPEMLGVVSKHMSAMILMHMRGTPETMQTMTRYENAGVVEDVTWELQQRSDAAKEAGIHRWQQVLDPGIGFAKDLDGNLLLLKHYGKIQSTLSGIPFLLGTSRKGFIGKITGETIAKERDYGTLASCIAAICLSGKSNPNFSILRVHNVKAIKQGTMILDAINHISDGNSS